jgi:hypothetical protein
MSDTRNAPEAIIRRIDEEFAAAEDAAPWVVQFYCCGRDDGTATRQTWEEADALRQSYVESNDGFNAGHQRSAVMTRWPRLIAEAASEGPRAEDFDRAIAAAESNRLTHVHWRDWRAKGHGTDEDHEMVGDQAHHEEAIAEYDVILRCLRAARVEGAPA